MKKKFFVYFFAFIILSALVGYAVNLKYPFMLNGFLSEAIPKEPETPVEEEKKSDLIQLNDEQIVKLGLKTQEAGPKKLALILSTRGKIVVHPDNLAHVVTKMSGIAKEARKNIGEQVKAGEVVAILESQEMAEGKAELLTAISKEKHALSIYNREKNLYDKKISASQDYFKAEAGYQKAMIETQSAKQKLKSSGLDQAEIELLANEPNPELRMYEVHAPIDGVIISRDITQGEYIENSAKIYTIANLNSVWVEMGIYPQDLFKVKKGQLVKVALPTHDLTAEAKIIYLSPMIEDETFITKAIAELSNVDGKWLPGMFVNLDIATGEVSVPLASSKESIQTIDGQSCLFVRKPEGFEKRFVTLGQSDHDHVEIVSGLEPGEQCVASKAFLLKAEIGKDSIKDDD